MYKSDEKYFHYIVTDKYFLLFLSKKEKHYFDKATTVEVTAMANADSIQAMLDRL